MGTLILVQRNRSTPPTPSQMFKERDERKEKTEPRAEGACVGGGGRSNMEMRAEKPEALEKVLCPFPHTQLPHQPQIPQSSPKTFSPTRKENLKTKSHHYLKMHRSAFFAISPKP